MKFTMNTPLKKLRTAMWQLGYNPMHMTKAEIVRFLRCYW